MKKLLLLLLLTFGFIGSAQAGYAEEWMMGVLCLATQRVNPNEYYSTIKQ